MHNTFTVLYYVVEIVSADMAGITSNIMTWLLQILCRLCNTFIPNMAAYCLHTAIVAHLCGLKSNESHCFLHKLFLFIQVHF